MISFKKMRDSHPSLFPQNPFDLGGWLPARDAMFPLFKEGKASWVGVGREVVELVMRMS